MVTRSYQNFAAILQDRLEFAAHDLEEDLLNVLSLDTFSPCRRIIKMLV